MRQSGASLMLVVEAYSAGMYSPILIAGCEATVPLLAAAGARRPSVHRRGTRVSVRPVGELRPGVGGWMGGGAECASETNEVLLMCAWKREGAEVRGSDLTGPRPVKHISCLCSARHVSGLPAIAVFEGSVVQLCT